MLTEKETTVSHRSPANTSDRVDHRPKKIKRVKVAPQQRCLWRVRHRAFLPKLGIAPHQMGTLLIVAFTSLMKFLNFLKPKPAQPTIDSYGQQSCGVEQQQIQSLMEWLFASLMAAGYSGKSHLIWYNSENPDPSLERVMKKAMHSCEPIFLYRCGGRVSPPPTGYYWRMMDEHPSMRIYQLEVKDGE